MKFLTTDDPEMVDAIGHEELVPERGGVNRYEAALAKGRRGPQARRFCSAFGCGRPSV